MVNARQYGTIYKQHRTFFGRLDNLSLFPSESIIQRTFLGITYTAVISEEFAEDYCRGEPIFLVTEHTPLIP